MVTVTVVLIFDVTEKMVSSMETQGGRLRFHCLLPPNRCYPSFRLLTFNATSIPFGVVEFVCA